MRTKIAIVVLLILSSGLKLNAQSGETSVYVDQFSNLIDKMNQISTEGLQAKSQTQVLAVLERDFALQKLVHQLEETVRATNVNLLKHGQQQDKRLLLIVQGCMALDFVLEALHNYLMTEDRAFLGFATDGKAILGTITKIL